MATVWAARLEGADGARRLVAIKTMDPMLRADADAERMFQKEGEIASRIHHPNVVEVLEAGEQDGVFYLVMEWIFGEPLSTIVTHAAKVGGIPLGVAVKIGAQIGAGLHAAHELTYENGESVGLVHRDVSPHNILVGFGGLVKLVDFGIAKVNSRASFETLNGTLKGKVAYMAPEQIRLAKLDRKTDIFAAGVVVYLLTTGRHPFKQADQHETALAICSDEPAVAPSTFLTNYPKKLERVVLRALAKSPAERYDTAREFGEELAKALPPSLEREPRAEIQAYMERLLPAQRDEGLRLVRDALGAGASWELTPCTAGVGAAANSASGATLRAVSASLAAPIDLDDAELEMLPDEPFGAADLPRLASLARPVRAGWRASARLASTAAIGVAIGAIVMFAASRRTEPGHGVLAAQPVSAPEFRPVGLSKPPAKSEPAPPADSAIAMTAPALPIARPPATPKVPAANAPSVPEKSSSLAEAVLAAKNAGKVAEPVAQPSSGAPANSRINGGALRKSE